MRTFKKLLFGAAGMAAFVSCDRTDDFIGGDDGGEEPSGTIFENKSNLEPLVAIQPQFNFVDAFSMLSSSDVLEDGFRFVGAADGAGLVADPDSDGFLYIVNAEDDYAVARIRLDENLTPTGGDYLLNSGVADFARQCSGTMLRPEVHGSATNIFLSASESFNFDVKGIDPFVATPTPNADFGLDALGEFAWENAVPLPAVAFPGETVIIGGDDDSSGSLGQIILYHSENGEADLNGGEIYVLRLTQMSDGAGGVIDAPEGTIVDESMLDYGVTYTYEFVKIENGAGLTQGEMETACVDVFASAFMRVEDVDYRKGSAENNRSVFVAVTGRGPGRDTFNDWGTAYRMDMDADNVLTGSITQLISGNTDTNNQDGNLATLQSPDNITVTENFIYLQEDPNSFDRGHAAYIYQTDLNGNNAKVVLELVVRQDLDPTGSTGLSGEFGALEDISDLVGIPDTFLLNLQPHYWESDDFLVGDGDDIRLSNPDAIANGAREDDQGGQIVILRGLPR